MSMKNATSLIDTLAEMSGCEYISDLPRMGASGKAKLADTVRTIELGSYPLQEWNYLLVYLTKEPAQETAEQAKALLLERLCEKKAESENAVG